MDPTILENLVKNIDPKVLENLIKNIDPKVIANILKNNKEYNNENNNNENNIYKIGENIVIKNLKNELFNNNVGEIISFNNELKRYNISLENSNKIISIKEENIFSIN